MLLGTTDTIHADFNPELDVTVIDSEGGANSDFTTSFNLPAGDVNFAGLVVFIPTEWGITPGGEIPIGAIVGKLSASITLGIINGACDNDLLVEFTFLNASIDPTDTVPFTDENDDNDEDYTEDRDNSGLQDGFEKYPEFITRVLVDENDEPLTPIRRSAGIQIVAGATVLLQFLVFEPGTFINENIPNDESLGFPTVTLLQNAGDEEAASEPGPITDFCTPLRSTNITFGVSRDNPCTNVDGLDPIIRGVCSVTSAPLDLPEAGAGSSDPDESGQVLFTNPAEGTYTFTTIGAGLRDADGDGYENLLDTCPFDINVGDPRIRSDGDNDEDSLDAACDPDDSTTNSDQDLDGYLNRQDNCPLDANGEDQDNQRDTDTDQVGDACDPNPDDADAQGELIVRQSSSDVVIGPGGAPAEGETPVGDGDGDGDSAAADDDDGGSSIILIIIGIIAAVVVVGGGAFVLMRRSGGGGA